MTSYTHQTLSVWDEEMDLLKLLISSMTHCVFIQGFISRDMSTRGRIHVFIWWVLSCKFCHVFASGESFTFSKIYALLYGWMISCAAVGPLQVHQVAVQTSNAWSPENTSNDFVPFSEKSAKPYNRHLIDLGRLVHTASYGSSFSQFLYCFHGLRVSRLGHTRKKKFRSITCRTDLALN